MDTLDYLCEILGFDHFDNKPMIQAHQGREGVKNSHQLLAISTILLNLIVLDVGSVFLVNTLTFIYPLHKSLQLIKSTPNIEDYAQWITFWVLYNCVVILDTSFQVILSFLPLYQLLKVIFESVVFSFLALAPLK